MHLGSLYQSQTTSAFWTAPTTDTAHESATLAVMETETWFIAETSHYERINPKLTRPFIEANIDNIEGNVNPFVCSPKAIYDPAETLKSIYKLVGLIYEKDANHRRRTINALDYSFLTKEVAARIEQDLQP